MTLFGIPILTLVTFSPLAGVLLLLFVDRERHGLAKVIALATSFAVFLISLPLWWWYEPVGADFQFVERVPWISAWGAEYHLGLDGISLLLVLLTTLLTWISILSAWTAIGKHVREFMITILLLEVGMNGVFLALDVFLFYVFWEVMLFPMYFLIGVWGSERRLYAAIKFVVYTMTASVLMLVAILTLYYVNYRATGAFTFNLLEWYKLRVGLPAQYWLFAAFALAFAVKVPMFPLHTWLPDAHVEAPTAGSVLLAGVLLKMGAYGMLRFCLPLFPEAAVDFVPLVAVLSVIAILYGAAVSLVQKDLKKLVAYSSVSHMGFVTAGIFASIAIADNAAGMEGAILVMFSHGLLTGALFLLVGFLYERTHTRQIAEMSMLATPLPVLAGFFLFFTLGSLGLPGLSGFVGEFLSLLGLFEYSHVLAAIGAVGVILAACYLLWMYQRVWFNDRGDDAVKPAISLRDFSAREIVSLLPLVVFAVWVGVYPNTFLEFLHAPVQHILDQVAPSLESARGGAVAQLIDAARGLF